MLVTNCDCSDLFKSERLDPFSSPAQSSGKNFIGKRVANQSLMTSHWSLPNALGCISARSERWQGESLPTGSDRQAVIEIRRGDEHRRSRHIRCAERCGERISSACRDRKEIAVQMRDYDLSRARHHQTSRRRIRSQDNRQDRTSRDLVSVAAKRIATPPPLPDSTFRQRMSGC